METEHTKTNGSFQVLGRKDIVADFSGGTITSVGDGILLREIEHRTGILNGFADCFTDIFVTQREISPHTIASYGDTFGPLLKYLLESTGRSPAKRLWKKPQKQDRLLGIDQIGGG